MHRHMIGRLTSMTGDFEKRRMLEVATANERVHRMSSDGENVYGMVLVRLASYARCSQEIALHVMTPFFSRKYCNRRWSRIFDNASSNKLTTLLERCLLSPHYLDPSSPIDR
jgi:hypothetical protein